MKLNRRIAQLAAMAVLGAPVSVGLAASAPGSIAAQHAGVVTYLDIDQHAIQDGVLQQKEAAMYPLELDFLWGRGAKQTDIGGVEWSIANPAGRSLVNVPAGGPVVLAALPDGRYTVTGWYEGTPVKRTITVHNGEHTTVLLEWAQ